MTGAAVEVVGLGLVPADHLTPEADRALRRARRVLALDTGVGTVRLLEARCARVTWLHPTTYAESRNRVGGYEHIAAQVIAAALEDPPVVYAVQGHPMFGVYSTFLVRDAALAAGLSVRILPGISSLDALCTTLGVDPFAEGLQAYEATDLLLRRRPLCDDVPLVVWQVGTVETALHTNRSSRPERLIRLRAHLRRSHAADHPVLAIHAPMHPLMEPVVRRFPLSDLPAQAPSLHAGTTLFLPAARLRAIEDRELLVRVTDPDHLTRITYPSESDGLSPEPDGTTPAALPVDQSTVASPKTDPA